MSVARYVRFEVHFIPAWIHGGERVILVFLITEPRMIRQLR
jgi:hypothetical protein